MKPLGIDLGVVYQDLFMLLNSENKYSRFFLRMDGGLIALVRTGYRNIYVGKYPGCVSVDGEALIAV